MRSELFELYAARSEATSCDACIPFVMRRHEKRSDEFHYLPLTRSPQTSTFASLSRSPERPEEKRNSKSPVEQKAADNELVNKDSSSSLSTQSSSMQVQNNQPTVMVMPLPKLPLTLLPCPVEDDEDNLTQDTEDRKQMLRDDERRRKRGMLRTGFAVDVVSRNLIESRDDIDVNIIKEEGGGKNDKKVKGILTKIGLK